MRAFVSGPDIHTALNTPNQTDDLISVCDRLIVSLTAAGNNASVILDMLRDMKLHFHKPCILPPMFSLVVFFFPSTKGGLIMQNVIHVEQLLQKLYCTGPNTVFVCPKCNCFWTSWRQRGRKNHDYRMYLRYKSRQRNHFGPGTGSPADRRSPEAKGLSKFRENCYQWRSGYLSCAKRPPAFIKLRRLEKLFVK